MTPVGLSISEFAGRTNLTLNAAFRKVQRLEKQGLVRVIREETRAGRPVRFYACPYQAFFIPSGLTSLQEQISDVFEPLQRYVQACLVQALQEGQNPVGGLLFTVDRRGLWLLPATPQGERWHPVPNGDPVVVNDSGPLYLSYQDAQELAGELRALFDRYRERRGNTPTPYFMHQVLTPLTLREHMAVPHAGYTKLL